MHVIIVGAVVMHVIIVGAGGLGKEVLEIFRLQGNVYVAGFADDNEELHGEEVAYGVHVLHAVNLIRGDGSYVIAIGDNQRRRAVAEMIDRIGHGELTNAIHPSAIVPETAEIGIDVIIGAGAILTSHTRVGDHVHIDAGCVVSHDVVLEDFVRLNPRVSVCGSAHIGEGAYIGAGAVIREGLTVGAWSRVGMGSVVVKDVPKGVTVFGNPAKEVTAKEVK